MNRILHIIPSLASGGAERQLTNLVNNSSAEFTHVVCAFNNVEFFGNELGSGGSQVIDLKVSGKHPWLAATRKLLPVIREQKPDVIVTWLYDANIVGRLINLFGNHIPLVTTLHSTDYDPQTLKAGNWSSRKVSILRQIDKLTARLAQTKFVAVSQSVKESFQNNLQIPADDLVVIYNGINPDLLNCESDSRQYLRRSNEIPDDAFVYITVGRLDILKNHQLLLKAFAKLSETSQAYLVIVGTGLLENELKKMAEALGITPRTFFFGQRKDIGACLEMADAFVFPTLLEGHPMALVEAMFKHLPCVASDIPVMHEVLTDDYNGLLFTANDAGELTAAMRRLLENEELRQRLSEQAFKDAENRFHVCITVAQWENLLKKMIK